jgi:hypothetical protein
MKKVHQLHHLQKVCKDQQFFLSKSKEHIILSSNSPKENKDRTKIEQKNSLAHSLSLSLSPKKGLNGALK